MILDIENYQKYKLSDFYVQSGIDIAFPIFDKLPCFKNIRKELITDIEISKEVQFSRDPNFISNIKGKAFHVNSVLIDNFLGDLGLYKPKVNVYVDYKHSYIIIEDRINNGAPLDLDTVYFWKGGIKHYLFDKSVQKDILNMNKTIFNHESQKEINNLINTINNFKQETVLLENGEVE